jgi:hypothetical protein
MLPRAPAEILKSDLLPLGQLFLAVAAQGVASRPPDRMPFPLATRLEGDHPHTVQL